MSDTKTPNLFDNIQTTWNGSYCWVNEEYSAGNNEGHDLSLCIWIWQKCKSWVMKPLTKCVYINHYGKQPSHFSRDDVSEVENDYKLWWKITSKNFFILRIIYIDKLCTMETKLRQFLCLEMIQITDRPKMKLNFIGLVQSLWNLKLLPFHDSSVMVLIVVIIWTAFSGSWLIQTECLKYHWVRLTLRGTMNPGEAGRMQETRKDTQNESNKYLQFLEGVSLCLLVLWNHVVVGRMTARENPEQTHTKEEIIIRREQWFQSLSTSAHCTSFKILFVQIIIATHVFFIPYLVNHLKVLEWHSCVCSRM